MVSAHVVRSDYWRSAIASLPITAVSGCDDVPLVRAAKQKDTAAVRALLQQRVDVNAAEGDGATALHWAAYHDDLELVELLLRRWREGDGRQRPERSRHWRSPAPTATRAMVRRVCSTRAPTPTSRPRPASPRSWTPRAAAASTRCARCWRRAPRQRP